MYDKELKKSIDALRAVIILATKATQETVNEVKKKQHEFAKPFYGKPIDWLAGMYEDGLHKIFHEKHNHEPNDPLAGMHVDEKNFPTSAAYMARTMDSDWKKKFDKHFENLEKEIKDRASIKAWDEAVKKYAYDDNAKNYPDYVCIKDFGQMKVGDIIKYQYIQNYNKYVYAFIDKQNMIINSTKEDLENLPEHFQVDQDKIEFHDKDGFAWFVITKSNKFWQDFAKKKAEEIKPFEIKKNADGSYYFEIEFGKIEQPKFDLLEENQIITFTLKNSKTYKAQVLKDSTTKMYYLNAIHGSNAIYFMELNQMKYKNNLNKLYGNNDIYPSAPSLECLTNDLNTIMSLPDLSKKETPLADLQKEVETKKQCLKIIEAFLPFCKGDKESIQCAIAHCDLCISYLGSGNHFQSIKIELNKMLSE